jgi:hypothetical protein
MVGEVSENDDVIDFLYRNLGSAHGFQGNAAEARIVQFPLDFLSQNTQTRPLHSRHIQPMMSGGMKVKVEATFEDNKGNKIGVGVTVEKEREINSDNRDAQAPDPDNKPDSLDKDFDQ